MTRFLITLQQAVETVLFAFSDMQGSEVYVKKIPSINILDLARAVAARRISNSLVYDLVRNCMSKC